MVKVEKLNKYFNKGKKNQLHIINNTTLEFNKNGLVAILGASGSGKTTLLNVIGGLDKSNSGKIYINGIKVSNKSTYKLDKIRNLNIGYIFQDYKLIDNLSVFENVAISLKMVGIKNKEEIEKRVSYVLNSVNMYRYRNRPAKMLSGGERQRVSIARAIVKNPNIVIADEPTGNLDAKNSLEIMNIIKSISKDKLVILVTHEVELAKFYASRIIEIQDGKIINDYENEINHNLEYRLDNKIYLKELEKIEERKKEKIKLDVFADKEEKIDAKIIIKNGNIYIKAKDKKVEVIDENSIIELVNEHYKKIDKSIYEQNNYNINEIIDGNKKLKYSSIYGIFKSIIQGFKKIGNYSVLKKILLLGYFASAMFIVYSVSNIFGTINLKESDFITKTKEYLKVDIGKIKIDDYSKYEQTEGVEYIIPGDSMITFKIKMEDYYQLANTYLDLKGSLTSIDKIKEEDLIYGRMPENQYEIVIDKMTIDNIENFGYDRGYSAGSSTIYNAMNLMGLRKTEDVLNRRVTINNMPDFKIVGITDKVSPSIYVYKENFINIINNFSQTNRQTYFGYTMEETKTENIFDYNLYLDDITLKQGRLPTGDYEVIVNITNKNQMKLNKTIETKVNDTQLKVVGYYESKTNMQNYLVNNNTIKYNIISNNTEFTICPKDKELVMNKFKNDYNLELTDIYEKDRSTYMENKKDAMISSLIFATVILGISLVEIFLMMRSSFLSRIKEIGTLRAIGVKKSDIYKMFIGEILGITTITSLPGVILMTYIIKSLLKLPYMESVFMINTEIVGICILILYGFNILIGLLPLHKVIKNTPASILARHDVE